MQTGQPNLFTRHDTIFGVCEGLGEDLGIHPNILRLAFPLLLFVNPLATVAGYAALGAIVLASRMLAPPPRPTLAEPAERDAGSAPEAGAGNDDERLPIAA